MTQIINEINDTTLKQVIKIIDDGGIIAFPTETVYALAADALNKNAVEKIYEIKKRVSNKPLPILVGEIYQAKRLVDFTEEAKKLALNFFPGALTMVLKAKQNSALASNINNQGNTIAIRMPNNLTALKILKAAGRPLIGTSANLSSMKNATNSKEVLDYFTGLIDLVVDLGEVDVGTPSTIIDLSSDKISILRAGAIDKKIIEEILGIEIN